MRRFLWVLAVAFGFVGSAVGQTRNAMLREMADSIAPCVEVHPSGVFGACYDTHSSIHAHWAAFRLARELPSAQGIAETSRNTLTFGKVSAAQSSMQYPYAAAWFLRLAMEFESWSLATQQADPQRLRPIGDAMALYLYTYYQQNTPNPKAPEYLNPSWHLYNLFEYFEFNGDTTRLAVVDKLIKDNFVQKIQGTGFGKDKAGTQFFSIYGNWVHLILETQDPTTIKRFLEVQNNIPDAALDLPNPALAHGWGVVWSRVWAFEALAQAKQYSDPLESLRLRIASRKHALFGMQIHKAQKPNFVGYTHWVPQFAVFALSGR